MLNLRTTALLAILAALLCTSQQAAADEWMPPQRDLPPHPRTLLDAAQIEAVKTKAANHEWADKLLKGLIARADAALEKPLNLPKRGGAWYHFYACPECSGSLRTIEKIGDWQWKHRCNKCKEVFLGDPGTPRRDFDGYIIQKAHWKFADDVQDLGLAYQFTGDNKYADKARAILLGYTEFYLDLPRRNHHGWPWPNSGRIATHMLSEALFCIPAVVGADMIWETLSDDEREQLYSKLFSPLVQDILLPQDTGYHNRQVWKNSAIGLVGLTFGDQKLIAQAIDHPKWGTYAILDHAIDDSGAWDEGSWSYHMYALSAIWPLLESAMHIGVNMYEHPRLEGMYLAPFHLSSPAGLLPAFNDSGQFSIGSHTSNCELALARFGKPIFASLLNPERRRGNLALFYGLPELPKTDDETKASNATRVSTVFPEAGYGILTTKSDENEAWLCIKFGPYGGGHGHPDKGGFELHANGQRIAIDPGMALYGTDVHKYWYKTTLAHNTLTVDESNQKPATGKLLSFDGESEINHIMIDAGAIDRNIRFVRTVVMLDATTIVFIDQIISGNKLANSTHTFDLALHTLGSWPDEVSQHIDASEWQPPNKAGYSYLENAFVRSVAEATTIQTSTSGKGTAVAITMAGSQPTELITASGVGAGQKRNLATLIQRRKAAASTFIWGISLDEKPVAFDTKTIDATNATIIANGVTIIVDAEKGIVTIE